MRNSLSEKILGCLQEVGLRRWREAWKGWGPEEGRGNQDTGGEGSLIYPRRTDDCLLNGWSNFFSGRKREKKVGDGGRKPLWLQSPSWAKLLRPTNAPSSLCTPIPVSQPALICMGQNKPTFSKHMFSNSGPVHKNVYWYNLIPSRCKHLMACMQHLGARAKLGLLYPLHHSLEYYIHPDHKALKNSDVDDGDVYHSHQVFDWKWFYYNSVPRN